MLDFSQTSLAHVTVMKYAISSMIAVTISLKLTAFWRMVSTKSQKLDVEMAVGRQDVLYKDYTTLSLPLFLYLTLSSEQCCAGKTGHTNTTQKAPMLHGQCHLPVISQHSLRRMSCKTKDVGMGVVFACSIFPAHCYPYT